MNEAVIYVEHEPGGRLSNGSYSGIGGRTTYRVAITSDGITRRPIGAPFSHPKKAVLYAHLIDMKLQEGKLP